MSLDYKLKIDANEVKSKIVDFLRSTLEKRDISGLVVLYRHTIESLTNVQLAIESVGKNNVKILVTKGRFLNKQPREEMNEEEINRYLKLPKENIVFVNKTGVLREIRQLASEGYDLRIGVSVPVPEAVSALNYNLSYILLRDMAASEMEKRTYAPPTKKPSGRREKFIQKSIAHHKSQIRLRVLLAFLLAEGENKSFIGSANKTEWLLGLFTKFGTYHAADFLPLACLYRTQVIQLANNLGLQQFLATKISQSPTIYEHFFHLPVEEVDRILIRFESGFSVKEVFEETEIPLEAIQKVDYYYQASTYARTVPLIPKL